MPSSAVVSLSLSADGSTLAVGATEEASAATVIAGDQSDDSAPSAGAVYVFTRGDASWSEPQYLKSPTTQRGDRLGFSLALSRDGSTLAAGTRGAAAFTGAVNVFTRDATTWSHRAQVTASNASPGDLFGSSLALSSDGAALAVGALGESRAATGIGGDQTNHSAPFAGAVYVFTRTAAAWRQKYDVKASNSAGGDLFGNSVALSGDGVILAVGAPFEDSAATGIDRPQLDDAGEAGAAYVFQRRAPWVMRMDRGAARPSAGRAGRCA